MSTHALPTTPDLFGLPDPSDCFVATPGFAILDQLRARLPHAQALLAWTDMYNIPSLETL